MFTDRIVLQSGLLALAVLTGAPHARAVAAENQPAEAVLMRPDPEGRATRVVVGAYVVDVAEIDDARRTFTADLYVLLRWNDRRLASPKSPRRVLPLNTVWHPGVLILNRRNVNRLLPDVVRVGPEGNVEYQQRFQGTFSVPLDLRNFPLDEQALAVRFVSPGLSPAQLELVPDERGGRVHEFSILDWAVGAPTCYADAFVTPDGSEIAGITCTLPARRRTGAYVYQFVIPLTFIVCMSWAPFWMAPEQLGPRQGIAVTSMLTIIAYRFVLASQLPRVAYLTRLDYLLLGCTTLVFLVLVEVVASHLLMTRGRPESARRLDVRSRAVFPALFLVLVIAVAVL
jgi:hypothetical protein